ncbi:MAG: M14 family metallopeptidase [Acidobacteriota bacterium]|jgi:hypothetical protein
MGLFLGGVLMAAASSAVAAEPVTVAEASNFTRTSSYREVVELVQAVAASSELVTLATLTRSPEGREVPLAILSRERVTTPAQLAATGKPAVLIMANIHAGEVEGKEATQMLIREVGSGRLAHLLDHQVVLVLPIFNTDGNEQFGRNRRDNGPELAGVRHNGQFLDLNRDFTKLESPEVRGLVRLLNQWDPVLVVDMHTTNGSYHRAPVTYTTGSNPNGSKEIADFMWDRLFPAVAARLKEAGWLSIPYGNFANAEFPQQGWVNDSIEVRYGTNYVALRNRLAILDENYSYADFRTRVLSSFAFIKAILEFSGAHAGEILALVRRVDAATRDGYGAQGFVPEWRLERLLDVTVPGFEHVKVATTAEERARAPWLGEYRMRPTEVARDYTVPYLARAVPTRTVPLPAGYVLLPGFAEAGDTLLAHGIAAERLLAPAEVAGERFALEKVEISPQLFQGHATVSLTGSWERTALQLPAGAVYVDLRQPLARLIPQLLEPSSGDGLAAWGMFNRALVRQWTFQPGVYPVLRVERRPPVPMTVLTP